MANQAACLEAQPVAKKPEPRRPKTCWHSLVESSDDEPPDGEAGVVDEPGLEKELTDLPSVKAINDKWWQLALQERDEAERDLDLARGSWSIELLELVIDRATGAEEMQEVRMIYLDVILARASAKGVDQSKKGTKPKTSRV